MSLQASDSPLGGPYLQVIRGQQLQGNNVNVVAHELRVRGVTLGHCSCFHLDMVDQGESAEIYNVYTGVHSLLRKCHSSLFPCTCSLYSCLTAGLGACHSVCQLPLNRSGFLSLLASQVASCFARRPIQILPHVRFQWLLSVSITRRVRLSRSLDFHSCLLLH